MDSTTNYKSSLSITNGVVQPPPVDEEAVKRFREKKKKKYSAEEFVEGILNGDRVILSQAITLVESSLPVHYEISQKIVEKCLPYSGKSVRIGITGVPGVGKSSFIEILGKKLTAENHKLAVLAIDPSSERSKGSILGDKTRMELLSSDRNAFIRPSPSAGTLGGVARKTRETIILCEAAGFDIIFVETVGVGQSETAVHSMVDFFLLLMLAGAGDELQGIKRGIMEMADAIAITKADGSNINKTERAKSEYINALHLFPIGESGWAPRVITCSSHKNKGIDDVWEIVSDFIQMTTSNGFFEKNRNEQSLYWMNETIMQNLKDHFYNHEVIQKLLEEFRKKVSDGTTTSFNAAHTLLSEYFKMIKSVGI
jgi:LAO/AO transport system kinase